MPSKYARKSEVIKSRKIYICCEGEKTEPNYFNGLIDYLKLSEAKVYIIDKAGGCSSPKHVFEAVETEIKELKKMRQYLGVEEFWLVMDVDKWNGQLNEVIAQCHNKKHLFTAISNPCFEVWLYYHKFKEKPNFVDMHLSAAWKEYIDGIFPGGFDSRKHPIFIYEAITNAKENFMSENSSPRFCSTEVCFLAEKFYPYVKEEINRARQMLSGTQSDLF